MENNFIISSKGLVFSSRVCFVRTAEVSAFLLNFGRSGMGDGVPVQTVSELTRAPSQDRNSNSSVRDEIR